MQRTFAVLARSAWKGPYFVKLPEFRQAQTTGQPIRTTARSCTILPIFVGLKFLVHNGKDYIPVTITEEMVGHKLGISDVVQQLAYEFSHQQTAETLKRELLGCVVSLLL
ncbi:1189_t:CDS:2, partial [Dentiscutata erythropus]